MSAYHGVFVLEAACVPSPNAFPPIRWKNGQIDLVAVEHVCHIVPIEQDRPVSTSIRIVGQIEHVWFLGLGSRQISQIGEYEYPRNNGPSSPVFHESDDVGSGQCIFRIKHLSEKVCSSRFAGGSSYSNALSLRESKGTLHFTWIRLISHSGRPVVALLPCRFRDAPSSKSGS